MAGTSKQRMRKSNNNLRSTSHGWKLDDIYLNFWDPSLDQRRRRKEDGYEQSASIANADDNVSGAVDLPNINFEGIS